MKKFINGRELLRPGITRFATNFITFESIVHHKKALCDMFQLEGWMNRSMGGTRGMKPTKSRKLS